MENLLRQLEKSEDNTEIKLQIEVELKQAYIGVSEIRKRTLAKTLTLEYIEEIERLFKKNSFDIEAISFTNKYLTKYSECLHKFWETYTYYNWTQRSRGKFDLKPFLKLE